MAYEPQNYSYWTSNILGKITLSYSGWPFLPKHYSLGKRIFYYIFYFKLILSIGNALNNQVIMYIIIIIIIYILQPGKLILHYRRREAVLTRSDRPHPRIVSYLRRIEFYDRE